MKKFLAVLSIVLLIASPVLAYDNLVSGDTSTVRETGTMCASAQLLYWTASEGFDADGESYDLGDDDSVKMAIPVKFRYGMMDKLELFGVLGVLNKWDFGDAGETGVGDLWLGAKYGLMDEGLLTLRGALLVPLGDDEKGLGEDGGFGIDVAALTTKQMDAITLNGQAGVRWAAEDGDTKMQPGLGIWVDGEASYAISDMLSCQAGLELLFRGDNKFDGDDMKDTGRNWYELNLGAMYMLADNMGLKGDVLFNLGGANTEKNMGVLLGFMYGF